MEIPRWAIPAAASLTAAGLVLAACGEEDTAGRRNAAAGTSQAPAADPSADSSASAEPEPAPATLEVASVAGLGRVVTDGEGRTLYRFDDDTARPSASSCLDACARAWPPVWAGARDPRVKGVEAALVGKVKRPDGKWQVTLAGWPMYRYAKDLSPGDVKGQAVGGTWYASAPDGKKAGAAAPPTRAAGEPGRWAGWTRVKVKRDAKLGAILTDGKGNTMYRYDKDRPKATTCFGACKKAWPPVTFTSWKKLELEGVDRKLVDFIERKDDGKCQLTIKGWPMYFYAKDARPGDTNGQAAMNVWWVVSQQGKKVTTAAGGGGTGGGGYGPGGY